MRIANTLSVVLAAISCTPLYAQDGTVKTWYGGGGNGEDVVEMGTWTFDLFSLQQQDADTGCENTIFNPPGEILLDHGWYAFDPFVSRIEMLDPLEFPNAHEEVGGGVMRFHAEGEDQILPFQMGMMEGPMFPVEEDAYGILYPEIVFFAQSAYDNDSLYYVAMCRIFDSDGYPVGGEQLILPAEVGMNVVRAPFPNLEVEAGMHIQVSVGVGNDGKEPTADKGPAVDKVKVELKKEEERSWKFVPDIKQIGSTCQGTAFANCLSWWANNGYPELAEGDTQAEKNENLRKALVELCHEEELHDFGPTKYMKSKGVLEGQDPEGDRPQLTHERYSGEDATWENLQEAFANGADVLLRLLFYKADGTEIPGAHYVTVSRIEKDPKKRVRAANPWGKTHDSVDNDNKDDAYETFDVTILPSGKIRLDNKYLETRAQGIKDCEYLCVSSFNVIRKLDADGNFSGDSPYLSLSTKALGGDWIEYNYTVWLPTTASNAVEYVSIAFDVPVQNGQAPADWTVAELPALYPDPEGCGDLAGGHGFAWSAGTPIEPGQYLAGFAFETRTGFPIEELGVIFYTQGEGEGLVQIADGPAPRYGDLDGDGQVNGADLGLMLANWGESGAGDLNGDGLVDGADLGALLAAWTG